MLEVSGGFRLKEETPSNFGIVAVLRLDPFERDIAVQLLITRQRDNAEPTTLVLTQDLEPLGRLCQRRNRESSLQLRGQFFAVCRIPLAK